MARYVKNEDDGKKFIWCLFSEANNYDQPENNLLIAWDHRPTLEEFATSLGLTISGSLGSSLVALVKIWEGESDSIGIIGDETLRIRKICLNEKVPQASNQRRDLT